MISIQPMIEPIDVELAGKDHTLLRGLRDMAIWGQANRTL